MDTQDVLDMLDKKIPIGNREHFLSYNIHTYPLYAAMVNPFIEQLAEVLTEIDLITPGYANEMVDRIASYTGVHEEKYEQLLQIFAEVHMIYRVKVIADEIQGKKYLIHEPKEKKGKKNPEFRSFYKGIPYAGEVKAPRLLQHQRARQAGGVELPTRWPKIPSPLEGEDILKPRDNPIKDFLESAQKKYDQYTKTYPDDIRLLIIYWDDFVYEPITAFLHDFSGLFTANSFSKDKNGKPKTYSLIDGVIIIPHLHQFKRSLANYPLAVPLERPFDFNNGPFHNVFIQNPHGRKVPIAITEAFNSFPPEGLLASEYQITDFILWL